MDDSTAKHIRQIAESLKSRLSPVEEKRLFKKIRKGDEKAIEKITRNYLMLVVTIALSYSRRYPYIILKTSDLIHEGYEGLRIAAQKFDYERRSKFSTYAFYWIRQKISRALCDHSRTIRISIPAAHQANLYNRIKNEAAQLQKEISLEEITEKMGTAAKNTKKLKKTLRLIYAAKVIPIDTPLKETVDRWNAGVIGDFASDKKNPNPEKMLQMRQMKEKAREMLSTLTPREEKVLRMRFGVKEKEDYSLEATGELFGITRERVRQIEAGALKKLRVKFAIGFKTSFYLNEYL